MINEFQIKLSEIKLELHFFNKDFNKYYKSLNSLVDFLKKENNFWSKFNSGNLNSTRAKYVNLNNQINTLVSQLNAESISMDQAIRNYRQHIQVFNQNSHQNFVSKSEISKRINYLFDNKGNQYAEGFYKFIVTTNINANNQKELFGAIDAYRLMNKWVDEDELSNIHTQFDSNLIQYTEKIDELDSKYIEMFDDNDKKYKEMIESTSEFKNQSETSINKFLEDGADKLKNIELLYVENMRLKGPAEYWKKLEKDYYDNGKKWMKWAVGFTSVLVVYLTLVLYNIPSLLDIEVSLYDLDSLRGTIIFALSVSMLIYIIRLFVKLSMSGYHLARDAKERYQLSHVYLSLINDNAIDEKDRSIVLQSLFSRADTGLLKGDSSPTIPDSITKQLFNINKPM